MTHDPSISPDPSFPPDSATFDSGIADEVVDEFLSASDRETSGVEFSEPVAADVVGPDPVDRWRPSAMSPAPDALTPAVTRADTSTSEPVVSQPLVSQPVVSQPVVSQSPWARPASGPIPAPLDSRPPQFAPPQFTPQVTPPQVPTPPQAPTPPADLARGFEGPRPVVTTPVKQSWAKPALVGGLIGALLSGAVSTAAVLATRQERTEVAAPITTVQSPASTRPAASSSGEAVAPADTSPSIGASANTIKAAYEAVAPAVVSISTIGFESGAFSLEPSEGAGSGIVVSPDGLVLTNSHVVTGTASIKVTFSDRSVKEAKLVGRSRSNDVALIRVQNVTNLPTATLGDSDALEVGDPVVAVGNALALEGGPTVTSGIISALDRDISDQDVSLSGLIQTDSAINPGNSGGPLVNMAGEVVGMNTAIIQNSNNIGFAIAMKEIKPLIEDLQNGGGDSMKPRTFIGVTTQTVDQAIQTQFDLAVDFGAIVVDVSAGSPAENAGLQPGDVIVRFDGKSVPTNDELGKLVRAKKPQDQVVVEWRRGQDRMTATVVLGQTTALG
jgi:S1-C subfamily serine protease